MDDFNSISLTTRVPGFGRPSENSQTDETPSGGSTEELIRQEIANQQSNLLLRETFADKAHTLAIRGMYFWCSLCLVYVAGECSGHDIIHDDVMIAFTTATTLNIFAAFLGVIKGLFPHHSQPKG